jgi:hypothetical protein
MPQSSLETSRIAEWLTRTLSQSDSMLEAPGKRPAALTIAIEKGRVMPS